MDYLTSFSQLLDCLLVLVCHSGNLAVFRLLECIFDYFTVFSAIWLSFRYLTVFRLFDYLSAIWLSFGFLTVFRLLDCLLAIWLSFIYLTICQLFDCLFRLFDYLLAFFFIFDRLFSINYLSAIRLPLAIWLSIRLFHCLLVIQMSFGYTRTTL